MPNEQRLQPTGAKKLLAIGGGGIRGVLSLEVLKRIEDLLRARGGRGDAFRLSDYFVARELRGFHAARGCG